MFIRCLSHSSLAMSTVALLALFVVGCDQNQPAPTMTLRPATSTPTQVVATAIIRQAENTDLISEPISTIVPLTEATIKVETVNQLGGENPERNPTPERFLFRPIATIDPNVSTDVPPTKTPIPIPTATQEPEHIRTARITLANRQTMGEATITILKPQLLSTLNNVRSLSSVLDVAREDGILDCKTFTEEYARIAANSPLFTVEEEYALPYFYYSRTVEGVVRRFSHLNLICEQRLQTLGERDTEYIPVDEIKPIWALTEALDHYELIQTHSNNALLWIHADDRVTVTLYRQTKSTVQSLQNIFRNAPTTGDCSAIALAYEELSNSPQFLPSMDTYRWEAYQWYLEAVGAAMLAGESINQTCRQFIGEDENGDLISVTPVAGSGAQLDSTEVGAALGGLRTAESFIVRAIALIPPPTPVPTRIPVYAQLIRTQEGQRDYLWELVLDVTIVEGQPPYHALVGGFVMEPNGRITIVHTCELDFIDHIILVDGAGRQFISQKVTASRPPHCFD